MNNNLKLFIVFVVIVGMMIYELDVYNYIKSYLMKFEDEIKIEHIESNGSVGHDKFALLIPFYEVEHQKELRLNKKTRPPDSLVALGLAKKK